MWDEFFMWVEKFAGVTFDMSTELQQLQGDNIFIDPRRWKIKLNYVIDQLNEMLDVLDEHRDSLTDNFPSYTELRNFLIGETLTSMITAINDIKRKLNIEPVDIGNIDTLSAHALALFDIVDALSSNSLEQLSKKDWFDEYEEDNDNILTDEFGLRKNDLTNMHFIVNDIIQLHEDDDDE